VSYVTLLCNACSLVFILAPLDPGDRYIPGDEVSRPEGPRAEWGSREGGSQPLPTSLGVWGALYKLPQLGLGRSPSRNRIWCILAVKSDI